MIEEEAAHAVLDMMDLRPGDIIDLCASRLRGEQTSMCLNDFEVNVVVTG